MVKRKCLATRHSKLGAFIQLVCVAMALNYPPSGRIVRIFRHSMNVQAQLQNPVLSTAALFCCARLAMLVFMKLRRQRMATTTTKTSKTSDPP